MIFSIAPSALQFVRQFTARGNTVIATVRQKKSGENLKGIDNVTVTELDVSKSDTISDWADEVAKITDHIDLVVNNAGVLTPSPYHSVTAEDMIHDYTTNTIGPLLVSQQLVKRGLLGGKKGSVIANVTSKVGSVDDNGSGGYYPYRASKSALNIISKSMSIDLAGQNITTTLLHPGYVMTDMTRGNGLIDTRTSVSGLISVLETKPLNGTW